MALSRDPVLHLDRVCVHPQWSCPHRRVHWRAPARTKPGSSFFGCVVFALPYLLIAIPFAHDFFWVSFMQDESSEAPNGLGARWISKVFLYGAFLSVLLSVVAVILRCIVALFGSPALADRADVPFARLESKP